MAKFKGSAIVAEISGTIGGNVFSKNKGGNYIRRYKKPTNANTLKQQNVRSTFGDMAGAWRGLTDAQRRSWIEGAVNFPYTDNLGEVKVYSGQQLFNKLNNNLAQIGEAILASCPNPQSFPNVVIDSVNNITAGNVLELSGTFSGESAPGANFKTVYQATASLSAGITSPQKARFKKLVVADGTLAMDESPLGSSYNATFGALVTGDTCFVSAFLVNVVSGEASVPVQFKTTRTAT